MQPFHWIDAATVSISATNAGTDRAKIASRPTQGPFQVRVHNAGSVVVFIAKGSSTVTAATTDMPIPPGAVEVLTIAAPDNSGTTHIAAATAASTATLYITTGAGY